MGSKAKVGEYILAKKTVRGSSKKDRRYKVKGFMLNGEKSILSKFFIEYGLSPYYQGSDCYLILHNGRYTYAECDLFNIDLKYMRKRKLSKIEKNINI